MPLFIKIVLLLWMINLAPPLLSFIFDEKWSRPLDGGYRLKDGHPLFGSHKTVRGILGAVAAGCAISVLMGFPWWLGFFTAILSMAGDLFSSFVKRRLDMDSGQVVPGLDQGFEGLLPLTLLDPYFSLGIWTVLSLLFIFGCGAYAGSVFFNHVLLMKPFQSYPRPLRPSVRLKDFRACQVVAHPLHHLINFEDSLYYHFFMKSVFRLLGVYEKGKRNALRLHENHVVFHFPDLPPSFDNYTILFFSDLHLDGLKGLTDRLLNIVTNLQVDLCILGGDFRMETHGPFAPALEELCRVLPVISARDGIYGILGNHDCIEMIEPLGKLGVKFLVNDAVAINRNGEEVWLVGVDDPHFFMCHDLGQAFEDVPAAAFAILAAHSNEIYREAAEYRPQLYICGHSHAGQIQLPLFGPLFTHSTAPRRFCHGKWDYGNMAGYTTGGVGVSGVPVRFACEGEVTVITLKRGRKGR